jgi:transporter family protein
MHWLIPLLLAALFLGLYNFFIKLSAGHIHEIVGAVILQVVAFLVGGAALVWLKWKGTPLETSPRGIAFAVFAGIAVGLAEITAFYAFSKGISASVGIPVMVGGTMLVGVLLGLLVLREQISLLQGLGVVLLIVGVALVTRTG